MVRILSETIRDNDFGNKNLTNRDLGVLVMMYPFVTSLALSFLILVGVALIVEGFDVHVPKGSIYFAMAFAGAVETFNVMAKRNRQRRRR